MNKAMHFKGIDDMNHAILRGLSKIPPEVDLVVGIPRSGLLAANMLSLYLNRPMADLKGLGERRLLTTGKRPVPGNDAQIFETARRILIVDDCLSQGTELAKARKAVAEMGFGDRALFLCVYSFPERPHLADIVLEVIPRPMCFQWSCMHSRELVRYCVDIDGVLCVDATKEQDDDGPNYLEFLRTAAPLFIPTAEIGWLVTSRLEKYREPTEEWLKKHGIRYRNLIMMDCASQAERSASNAHVAYKANFYKASGAILFIESSAGIARKIQELSGLPVLCVNPGEIYRPPAGERLEIFVQKAEWWGRRLRGAPRKLAKRVFQLRKHSSLAVPRASLAKASEVGDRVADVGKTN